MVWRRLPSRIGTASREHSPTPSRLVLRVWATAKRGVVDVEPVTRTESETRMQLLKEAAARACWCCTWRIVAFLFGVRPNANQAVRHAHGARPQWLRRAKRIDARACSGALLARDSSDVGSREDGCGSRPCRADPIAHRRIDCASARRGTDCRSRSRSSRTASA